jgi:hypothetical protein
MPRQIAHLIAAALTLAVLAGCSMFGPAAGLKTAPAAAQACMEALIGGTLTRNAESGLGITAADETQTAVEWPFGYSARNELGKLVLIDQTGTIVAHEGDRITVGGGLGDHLWYACGPVSVTKAAS